MQAKILRNQTIRKTPLGRYFPLTKCVCLHVPTTPPLFHSHPHSSHTQKEQHKTQLLALREVPNGNGLTDTPIALRHKYETKFGVARTQQSHWPETDFFLHTSKEMAKVDQDDSANHWTSLSNLSCEIAWDYVMQCLSQTRGKNDSHSGPFRTLPLGHPVCF